MQNTETIDRDSVMRDTIQHVNRVGDLLAECVTELVRRAVHHDDSKFSPEEFETFARVTPKLRGLTYGSDEYKASLAELGPALRHHYEHNSHHPEHFRWHCPVCNRQFTEEQYREAPQGPNDTGWRYCPECSATSLIYETQLMDKPAWALNGMTLLDLLEMLCDWKAAGERHADGSMKRSLEVNQKRFAISDQLQQILENTARAMKWA